MRPLILSALLALPVTAIAELPVNEDVHYFELVQCDLTKMVLVVTHNQMIPIRHMDRLTPRQRHDVRWARNTAQEQGNAYRVEMPARGKCHEL